MRRFRDPSRWTWWLMGGATIAVGAIWYLVDQKFQDSSASLARDAQLEKKYSSRANAPDLDELLPSQSPALPNQPLPPGMSPSSSKVTLQKPNSSVPPLIPGTGTMGSQSLPSSTFTNPGLSTVVIPQVPSATVSTAPVPIPRQRQSTGRTAISSPSFSADRPGALLPNLPDPMERYQSGSSSTARVESPIIQSQPSAPKKESVKPAPQPKPLDTDSTSSTSEDTSQSQMPELFSSGQGSGSSTSP